MVFIIRRRSFLFKATLTFESTEESLSLLVEGVLLSSLWTALPGLTVFDKV